MASSFVDILSIRKSISNREFLRILVFLSSHGQTSCAADASVRLCCAHELRIRTQTEELQRTRMRGVRGVTNERAQSEPVVVVRRFGSPQPFLLRGSNLRRFSAGAVNNLQIGVP